MKKSLYKIGDKVTVSFLGQPYESKIIEVRQHPSNPEKIIYTAKASDGLIIPYVGVNGSEKYANIFTEKIEKLILNDKQDENKRVKRKSKQSSKETD